MTTAIPWDIDNLTIQHGKHGPPNGTVSTCAMEAAYLRWAMRRGWSKAKIVKGWTDSLSCVCPMIGAFVRRWNDGIDDSTDGDAARTRIFTPELLDLLPDTKGDDALMLCRMWMAIDWDIRTRTPAFLRLAKLEAQAAALEALPEIRSQEDLANARAACEDAHQKGAAARAAAGAAAGAAALDAIKPTVEAMQASAIDLLRRMCAAR